MSYFVAHAALLHAFIHNKYDDFSLTENISKICSTFRIIHFENRIKIDSFYQTVIYCRHATTMLWRHLYFVAWSNLNVTEQELCNKCSNCKKYLILSL